MDDPTYEYANPAAAASVYARLLTKLRTVRAFNYEDAFCAVGSDGSRHAAISATQDVYLENLQEFRDLENVLRRARALCEHAHWVFWWMHRVVGWTRPEVARAARCSASTVQRYIGRADSAVRDQLVERGSVTGYGGRDLAYIVEEPRERVQVWHAVLRGRDAGF